ncbi:MAG: TonB-dependent receptor, partial [Chitinophagales bacterium]
RIQIARWLIADADVNYSKNNLLNSFLGSELSSDNLVPLAPTLTSTGGLTARFEKGFEASLRYRYIKDRPANEANTVVAQGYTVVDAVADYHTSKYKFGISIENLLNTEWNEAQFDTESRLFNEPAPVDELHFTPGTPFAAKGSVSVFF